MTDQTKPRMPLIADAEMMFSLRPCESCDDPEKPRSLKDLALNLTRGEYINPSTNQRVCYPCLFKWWDGLSEDEQRQVNTGRPKCFNELAVTPEDNSDS